MVTVVVPTYNDPRLPLCLEALRSLRTPDGWQIEVVVVDNASDTSPADLVAGHHPEAKFLVETRRGSYAARNAAIGIASGEVVAFTDSDCRPDVDWLDVALRRLEQEPALDAVAGAVRVDFRAGRPTSPVEWWEKIEAFPQDRYVQQGYGVTANLVVRRAAGDAIRWFDAGAQSGGDRDFGRRLTAAGHALAYESGAVVHHPARTSLRELLVKGRRTAQGHARLETLAGTPLRDYLYLRGFLRGLRTVVRRGLTHPDLPGRSARTQYMAAGLTLRVFWFVEKCRWRFVYGRRAAAGTLV